MSHDKLVYMANQIASFFRSQPGDDQVARIAAHLGDFWDPRMIAELQAHHAAGGAGLDDKAAAALDLLGSRKGAPAALS